MTAVQQRMYGMFSGVGGFSQFGAVGQVRLSPRLKKFPMLLMAFKP